MRLNQTSRPRAIRYIGRYLGFECDRRSNMPSRAAEVVCSKARSIVAILCSGSVHQFTAGFVTCNRASKTAMLGGNWGSSVCSGALMGLSALSCHIKPGLWDKAAWTPHCTQQYRQSVTFRTRQKHHSGSRNETHLKPLTRRREGQREKCTRNGAPCRKITQHGGTIKVLTGTAPGQTGHCS